MRTCMLVAALVLVAGCATQAPVLPDVAAPVVTTVQVPVSVPCVTAVPPAPLWATEVAGLPADEYSRARALMIERQQRRAYVPQLEAIVKGCR